MEHLGNDLGIAEESSSSNSSSISSDDESSSSSSASEKSAECVILTPTVDRFKKRTYQSTSLDSFVVKQPKASATSSPSAASLIHEEPSSRVVKVWTDPRKKKDRERRRDSEKKRREGKKADCSSRTKRVLGNIIDLQAARSGADMTHAEARASVVDEVIARINPPKKSKAAQSEDSSGHLRTEMSLPPEKLYHGEISKTGKRMFTSDETLFLFEVFCKHHCKDPLKKDHLDAVREMVQAGGDNCEWSIIAKRIAREHPKEFGAEHPCGAISRQSLKHRVRYYLHESTCQTFVGRRRALPETVVALIITKKLKKRPKSKISS